jgi:hypothetical protein
VLNVSPGYTLTVSDQSSVVSSNNLTLTQLTTNGSSFISFGIDSTVKLGSISQSSAGLIDSGAAFINNGTVWVYGGTAQYPNVLTGSFQNNNTLNVEGQFNVIYSQYVGPGPAKIDNFGELSVGNTGVLTVAGQLVSEANPAQTNVQGTLTISSGGSFVSNYSLIDSGTVEIQSGGTLTASNVDVIGSTPLAIDSGGIMYVDGTATSMQGAYLDNGTINFQEYCIFTFGTNNGDLISGAGQVVIDQTYPNAATVFVGTQHWTGGTFVIAGELGYGDGTYTGWMYGATHVDIYLNDGTSLFFNEPGNKICLWSINGTGDGNEAIVGSAMNLVEVPYASGVFLVPPVEL